MDERLPIQVVLPRDTDYSANKSGGSNKPLCPYTDELRANIEAQCIQLKEILQNSFVQFPTSPCIAKVTMKEKAIAKTHKPTAIFKSKTCPIVGAEKLNEVLVKVTPTGIDRLINTVKSASTQEVKISLTKIEKIESYSRKDKMAITGYDLLEKIDRPLKVKLFSLDDDADNEYFSRGFEELIKRLEISDQITKAFYGGRSNIYKMNCTDKGIIEAILKFPGLQKISFFPQYVCDRPNIRAAQKQISTLPQPKPDGSYPIIGLIDSGISPDNRYLMPWVVAKEEFVPKEYQNNDHGTFVAGIIEYGQILNDIVQEQEQFKILDVVVFPNDDERKGPTDTLSEDSLIEILHDVIGRYCDKVKVWNMSLGTKLLCQDIISDLAVALDEIQDLYGVDIIISAGNYSTVPLREWPPILDREDNDRITIPADSVRALTVGSIANIGIDGFVEQGMPSPFSRKGPGANFIIKPEVVYDGGNCTENLACSGTGIVSFDAQGNVVEGIGTSYSSPAVASIYASLRNSVVENLSREYAKAFLIHSCVIPVQVKNQVSDYNKYFGYGKPASTINNILTCSKSSVTLVFTGELFDGSFIEFNDFPFPKSLIRNGKCYGDIKMTLAYTPKLNASYGQEYCRANIDAHFGTYDGIDIDGSVKGFKGEVPLEKKWDEKYEASRVENGFKWYPIKSYSRNLSKGIAAKQWRLKVDCCARLEEDYSGQKFVLLITITDPKENDIYSEVLQLLREHGYIYNNLRLQEQIRQKIGL